MLIKNIIALNMGLIHMSYSAILGAGVIFFCDLLALNFGIDGLRLVCSCLLSAAAPIVALREPRLLERLELEYSSNFSASSCDMNGASRSDCTVACLYLILQQSKHLSKSRV